MATPIDFVFAGRRISEVAGEVVIRRVSDRSILALEVSEARSQSRDGSRFVEASLPPREIAVEFAVLGDGTFETMRTIENKITGALLTSAPARLVFDDQAGRFYEAILSKADVRRGGGHWIDVAVTFRAPRPYLYGPVIEATVGSTYVAETNWYVEPVWRIRAGQAAPDGFTLDVNGAKYLYEGALTSSQTVTINTAARETRLGNTLKVLEVAGDYPILRASNTISLSISGTIDVEYRARWA